MTLLPPPCTGLGQVFEEMQRALEEFDVVYGNDEEAIAFERRGEAPWGHGPGAGRNGEGRAQARVFVFPPVGETDVWPPGGGGGGGSARGGRHGSERRRGGISGAGVDEAHDWGSPEAAAAVRQLQSMGAQVFPAGGQGSGEKMDWGVLAGYEEQKRQLEDCLLYPLLRPEVG